MFRVCVRRTSFAYLAVLNTHPAFSMHIAAGVDCVDAIAAAVVAAVAVASGTAVPHRAVVATLFCSRKREKVRKAHHWRTMCVVFTSGVNSEPTYWNV
jgi:hypothetical protein